MNDNGVIKKTQVSKENTEKVISIADIEVADIRNLKRNELRKMCKTEGLIATGKKAELVRSLIVKKTGSSDKFAGNMTKCRMCGNRVQIICTKNQTMKDGRMLVTRTVKCKGRHRHTYPLKTLVIPDN